MAAIRHTDAITIAIIHQYLAHHTTIADRISCAGSDQPSAIDVRITSTENTTTTKPTGIAAAMK